MSAFFSAITRLFRDKSGNVAIIFAIGCVPVITALGCAVDYSMATRMKVKLQSAADAASVASISSKSAGFAQAATMTGNGTITAGVAEANNVFDGNMNPITGYSNLSRTATVTKTGLQLTSNVQFSAQIPVTFMKVLGYPTLTLTGTSSSSASLPPYLDFYLALDVSGSMGLPSTAGEQARLAAVNPDNYVQYPTGCTLACHFKPQNSACTDSGTQGYPTNNFCLGYAITRVSQSGYSFLLQTKTSNPKKQQLPSSIVTGVAPYTVNAGLPGSLTLPVTVGGAGLTAATSCPTAGTDGCIQLRLDAVGFALNATMSANGVSGLLELAQKKEAATGVPNEFRIGLYPFIADIDANYAPLTASINASSTTPGTINYAAANLATELDTNMNSSLGSGGTHIDNALHSLNNVITSVGDGSTASNTQPYVFLVTDGAQDPQSKGVPNGGWSGSNWATVLNDPGNSYPNICQTLKNRKIIVSVLYIPYQTISPVNASFANDEDDHANSNISKIPASLQACASPADAGGSYFYTANSPQEIQDSLNAMFNHSIQTAHITN
jgi:Flp pilus assembly protein TadG